jgi:hypothetical protein
MLILSVLSALSTLLSYSNVTDICRHHAEVCIIPRYNPPPPVRRLKYENLTDSLETWKGLQDIRGCIFQYHFIRQYKLYGMYNTIWMVV